MSYTPKTPINFCKRPPKTLIEQAELPPRHISGVHPLQDTN